MKSYIIYLKLFLDKVMRKRCLFWLIQQIKSLTKILYHIDEKIHCDKIKVLIPDLQFRPENGLNSPYSLELEELNRMQLFVILVITSVFFCYQTCQNVCH